MESTPEQLPMNGARTPDSLMRKTRSSLQSPPLKPGCSSTHHPSARSQLKPALQSPEPSSINGILQENRGEGLYVHPLHWVSKHLQLLNCHFVYRNTRRKPKIRNEDACRRDKPRPGRRQVVELKTEVIACAATALLQKCTAASKMSTVRRLLEDHGVCCVSFDLPFHFSQRPVATLRMDGFFSSPSPGITTPTLACLNLKDLESRRNASIKLSTHHSNNPPVTRLRQKKQQRLRPANEVEDPYIAALLIALAQQRQRQHNTLIGTVEEATGLEILDSSDPREIKPNEAVTCVKVHLLALRTADTQSLYFYTARISTAFLDRFNHPSQNIPSDQLCIFYRCIPLERTPDLIRAISHIITTVRDNN